MPKLNRKGGKLMNFYNYINFKYFEKIKNIFRLFQLKIKKVILKKEDVFDITKSFVHSRPQPNSEKPKRRGPY